MDPDISQNLFENEFNKVLTDSKKNVRLRIIDKKDPDIINLKLKTTVDSFGKINFFKFFIMFDPQMIFSQNEDKSTNNYSIKRRMSKVSAAYSIAKYYSFNLENENLDSPTLVAYFGITKFLFTFRFIESFRKLLYLISDIEILENIQPEKELGLFKDYLEKLNSNIILKKILFDLSREFRNEKNIFSEIGLNIDGTFAWQLNSLYFKNKYKENSKDLDIFYLSKRLKNSVIHSEISASSGSGNLLVLFTLTTLLAEEILVTSEKFFKERIFNEYSF